MRSAPHPPRGEAAPWNRVGAGLQGPTAGGQAVGSARVRAVVGDPGAGWGDGCLGLNCCLSSEQTCLFPGPWQLPTTTTTTTRATRRVCALCFPRGDSVSAFRFLQLPWTDIVNELVLSFGARDGRDPGIPEGGRPPPTPTCGGKWLWGHLRGSGTRRPGEQRAREIINLLSADL